MERTLVILKPDTLARGYVGKIVRRVEEKVLRIVALKMEKLPVHTIEKHYKNHRDKPFYQALVQFMLSYPVILMVLEGERVVDIVRQMVGKTQGYAASPGTIRGDFSVSTRFNMVHAFDSLEAALWEIPLFFKETEITSYTMPTENWVDSFANNNVVSMENHRV